MFKTVDLAVINACAEYMPKMRDDFLFVDSLDPVLPADVYSTYYEKLLHSVFLQVHASVVNMSDGDDVENTAASLYVLEEIVGKHPTSTLDEYVRLHNSHTAMSTKLSELSELSESVFARCMNLLDSVEEIRRVMDIAVRGYLDIQDRHLSKEEVVVLENKFKFGASVHNSSRNIYTELGTLDKNDADNSIRSVLNNNIGSFSLEEQFFYISDLHKRLSFSEDLLDDTMARYSQIIKACEMLKAFILAVENKINELNLTDDLYTEMA